MRVPRYNNILVPGATRGHFIKVTETRHRRAVAQNGAVLIRDTLGYAHRARYVPSRSLSDNFIDKTRENGGGCAMKVRLARRRGCCLCLRITPWCIVWKRSRGVHYSLPLKRERERARERGGGISGYTFSSHCAALKGVQWPWSESRIVSTARRNSSTILAAAAGSVSLSRARRLRWLSPPPEPSSRLGVNERGVPFWCYSWATDGASAPGPLNPRESPLKSPAIRRAI